jgi:hypothetical protein
LVFENGAFEFWGALEDLPHYELTAPGFGLVFANGGRITHEHESISMRLSLQTDVRCDATSSNQAYITTYSPTALGSQALVLSEPFSPQPVVRVFEVWDAAGLKPGVPELLVDMPLETTDDVDVELVKTGDGIMALERVSLRFRGTVSVKDGELWVNGPYDAQSPDPNFNSCGSIGRADVFVSSNGVLRGVGGTGGNVFVNKGGVFRPGTANEPGGVLNIGGNLTFANGSSWQVDAFATGKCNSAQVAGDIVLDGEARFIHDGAKRPKGIWDIATYGESVFGKMAAPQGCKVYDDKANKTLQFISTEPGTLLMVK